MTINSMVSEKSLKNEHWTAAYKKGTREMMYILLIDKMNEKSLAE